MPTSGPSALEVTFQNTSTPLLLFGVHWDFGDGTTSHVWEPTHTYNPGTYTVSLTLSDLLTGASKTLVTIGACATAGGIQALRNFADVREFTSLVYATPAFISTLDRSSSIAEHVLVDYELRGCPIDKGQLVEQGAVGPGESGYNAARAKAS